MEEESNEDEEIRGSKRAKSQVSTLCGYSCFSLIGTMFDMAIILKPIFRGNFVDDYGSLEAFWIYNI